LRRIALICHCIRLSKNTRHTGGRKEEELSELIFGAKNQKGDGSIELKPGLAEKATKGTLFLNEFENLSDQFQIRLLRLVQKGEYYRFSAGELLKTDARIIASTNQDIPTAIKNGKRSNDLYQRLNMHRINIPPLRERKEDIPLLVEHFVELAAEHFNVEKPFISRDLYILLQNYHFPGNVGQLARMTGETVKHSKNGVLNLDVFKEKMREQGEIVIPGINSKNPVSKDSGRVPLEFGYPLPSYEELEQLYMDELMSRAKNNKEKTAQMAGLTIKTLHHRLKRLDKKNKKENGNKI
jgi:DNA-binding NtrC family response regulator